MSSRRVSRKSSSAATRVASSSSTTTSTSRRSRRSEQQQHDSALEDTDERAEEEEGEEEQEGADDGEQRDEDGSAQRGGDEEEGDERKDGGGGDDAMDTEGGGGADVPASASFMATPGVGRRSRGSRLSVGESNGFTDDTPTRLSRLDEKSELQGLNKRLEFYILNRRERDASADGWVRELEALKAKHASELEHQKKLFENQLGLVRKNRDELSASLSKQEGENAHQANALKELQARLSLEHKARGALEGRVDALQKELLAAQNQLHSGSLQLSNLQHEYAALKSSHDDLEASLDQSRKTQEAAQSKANKLAQQYGDLSDEYDTLQTRHASDVRKYESEIHTLCQENHRSVDGIRQDTEARLNALFAERQNQYEQDKAEALQVMKNIFDEKLLGYRTRLEELGHELEQERSNHRAAARALDKESKNVANLLADLKSAQASLAAAEQALANERSNPELARLLAEKTEAIRRLKSSFKRKDLEFDELMDVKIMLDLEIKAYRTLLDQEDARFGVVKEERAREREREREAAEKEAARAAKEKQQQAQSQSTTTTTSSSSSSHHTSSSSSKKSSRSKRDRKSRAAAPVEEEEEQADTAAEDVDMEAQEEQPATEEQDTDGEQRAEGQEQAASADASEEAGEEATQDEDEAEGATPRKRRRTGASRSSRKSARGVSKSKSSTEASPADEHTSSSTSSSSSSSSKKAALLFSRVDASGEYVGMSNNSGKSASLSGWVLRAPRHGIEYAFPADARLEQGASYYVTSGEGVSRAREDRGDQVGYWPTRVQWADGGDVAELVSPAGTVVASVAVEPRGAHSHGRSVLELEGREQGSDTPEVVAGAASADNKCIVM